jgi:hypothetical protein
MTNAERIKKLDKLSEERDKLEKKLKRIREKISLLSYGINMKNRLKPRTFFDYAEKTLS